MIGEDGIEIVKSEEGFILVAITRDTDVSGVNFFAFVSMDSDFYSSVYTLDMFK